MNNEEKIVNLGDRESQSENSERKLTPVTTTEESVNQGKSIIVAIGIDEYENWQQLQNGVSDALGFQQVMVDKLGFTAPIEPLINEKATKDAIERLVEEQLREIVKEDDNLIIFFAGHGHTREKTKTGYIIPIEARSPHPKEYWGDYIRLDPWLLEIAELPARHILVILDACHSGFALGTAMNIFRDSVTYKKDLKNKKSRKVITSARRNQPAIDGGAIPGHSLFTGTLIDGLNWGKADLDGNGLITSLELGLFVQQKVGQASESKQTPDFGSFYLDDRGEMVIALRDQSFDFKVSKYHSVVKINPHKGKHQRAVADYTEAIKIDPKDEVAYNNRGLSYNNLEEYDKAITDFNQAIYLNSMYSDAYNNRGVSYKNQGKYNEAIADYNEAIQLDPEYAGAYCNRGLSYHSLGEYDKAIADYSKAISLEPKDPIAYANRGLTYHILKEYDKAIADYDRAIQIDPTYSDAYYTRANSYYEKRQYYQAIKDYSESIILNPEDTRIYNNRANSYNSLKEYDKAITDFNEVIRRNPNDAFAFSNRGVCYKNQGKYREAIADYNEAIRLDPKYAGSYCNRGLSYHNLGEYDKAITNYDKAINLDPQDAIAFNNRGLSYHNLGKYGKAISDYDEAIRINPRYSNAYKNRGLSYQALEK